MAKWESEFLSSETKRRRKINRKNGDSRTKKLGSNWMYDNDAHPCICHLFPSS